MDKAHGKGISAGQEAASKYLFKHFISADGFRYIIEGEQHTYYTG